jgi:hypothetical protein
MDPKNNPFLGPPVKCKLCGKRRSGKTTNVNGICSRHPEGNANLNKARLWEMGQTYKVTK